MLDIEGQAAIEPADEGPSFDIAPQQDHREAMQALSGCRNTLEFILESLSQALGMNQSQAAALLANNQKFLHHMCVKGLKGRDYQRLVHWYRLIMQGT